MKKLIDLLNEKTLELINMKKNDSKYRILKDEISVLQKTIETNRKIELTEVLKPTDFKSSVDRLQKELNIHEKTKTQERAEEIAKKYVYGNNDALTDNQEIIDMSKDIIEFAERYKKQNDKVYLVTNERTMVIHGCFGTMKKAVNFTKDSSVVFNIKKLYVE